MTDFLDHPVLARLGALRDRPEPLAALLVDLGAVEHGDDPRFAMTLDHYLESWLGARERQVFPLPGQRLLFLAPAEAAPLLKSGAEALMRVLRHHGFGQLRATSYDVATEAERLVTDILPPDSLDRAKVLAAAERVPTAALSHLLEVERALHGADLDSLVREQPVWSLPDGAEPTVRVTELALALDELEARLGVPLRRDSWLRHEAAALLDRGLLRHLLRDRLRDARPFAIDLHTGTVLEEGFAGLAIPDEVRGRLTVELACWEAGLSAPRFAAAAERLADLGFAVAVDHVPLTALATLDLGGLEPAYVKALWAPHTPDAGELLRAGLRRFGPERLVLWRCDTPAALEAGRAAGLVGFQGRAADAAAHKATSAAESPPEPTETENEEPPPAEPTLRPARLGRWFGRG